MKYKVELILVALLPVSVLLGWLLGVVLTSSVFVDNNEMVSYTTQDVKNDSVRSVKLIEGYDRRVQWTMPAYSLNMAHFENYNLRVK
jgi:hypothetical protein